MSIAEWMADSPTRNRVLGECRYFRAYIYLCLVTRFGDVPVLRQNTQAKDSRDPASMAWELVEEALDAASGFQNGMSADSFYYVSPAAVPADAQRPPRARSCACSPRVRSIPRSSPHASAGAPTQQQQPWSDCWPRARFRPCRTEN